MVFTAFSTFSFLAHEQGVLGESAPSVTSATRSYIVKEITCGCALFNLSFICDRLIQSDSDSWFDNITLNAAQVCGKSHKSAHFLKEAPGSSVHSLTTVILHRANMQHVQVQGKSAGLHCPSHRDICTVRLHKQARIISSTPTHPGHASPPCLWKEILASSIRNYETNSFIPQAAGAVAPSPPAPPNSFQPRTDSQHTHNPSTHPQPRRCIMSHVVI